MLHCCILWKENPLLLFYCEVNVVKVKFSIEANFWKVDFMLYLLIFSTPIDIPLLQAFHNGENDSHKRQFLALGVCSQSWKSNNLSIFFLVKLIGVTSCLLQFDRIFFCSNNFSNINCKVSNLRNKIADKRGQLALIS